MATAPPPTAQYQELPLEDLEISESNVRRREISADIDQLAHSMNTFGLQQPIVVQKANDKYQILIGQRRYLAAKQLEWERIPARILASTLDPLEAKVVSFSENVQRRDLSPKDKSDVCRYLYDRMSSVRAVAEYVGVSEPTVRKWLGYAAVPDAIKTLVEQNRLTVPSATRIFQAAQDDDQALAVAERLADLNPPPQDRQRILAALEESPSRPFEVLVDRAKELQHSIEIIFVLPERWSSAIEKASEDVGLEPSDIARTATIEWLAARRY